MVKLSTNEFYYNNKTGVVYLLKEITEKGLTLHRVGDQYRINISESSLSSDFIHVEKKSPLYASLDSMKSHSGIHKGLMFSKEHSVFSVFDLIPLHIDFLQDIHKELGKMISTQGKDKMINNLRSVIDDHINVENLAVDANPTDSVPKKNINISTANSTKKKIIKPTDLGIYEPKDQLSLNVNILKPDPECTFRKLILSDTIIDQIDQALTKYELSDFLDNDLGMSKISPVNKKCFLNFYGDPGTGKTSAVKAISNKIQKPIVLVDFSQLVSKYVGDTGKYIKKYFEEARKNDAILFLDEADSIISRRSDSQESNYANLAQNIFMQELDQFEGIVILATNFFNNYDPAIVRRFDHVHFQLPDMKERKMLLNLFLLKNDNICYSEDFSPEQLVLKTEKFSGADIKKACLNVYTAKVMAGKKESLGIDKDALIRYLKDNPITTADFLFQIELISKDKNSGKKNQKAIGLAA